MEQYYSYNVLSLYWMLNGSGKNNDRVFPCRGRRCWRRMQRVSGPGSWRVQEGSKSLFNTLTIKTGFVGHFLPYFFLWSNTHHRGHQSQACLLLFTYISRPRQCVCVCRENFQACHTDE